MSGETFFALFCGLWLVCGGSLLAARIIGGLRNLDALKRLKAQEKQFLEESVQHTEMMAEEAKAIDGQCSECRERVRMWERRVSGLIRKPAIMLRLSDREVPQPADSLWVATYAGAAKPVYGAVWAVDEHFARTKLEAGLGPDLGSPDAVMSLKTFKSAAFA